MHWTREPRSTLVMTTTFLQYYTTENCDALVLLNMGSAQNATRINEL